MLLLINLSSLIKEKKNKNIYIAQHFQRQGELDDFGMISKRSGVSIIISLGSSRGTNIKGLC